MPADIERVPTRALLALPCPLVRYAPGGGARLPCTLVALDHVWESRSERVETLAQTARIRCWDLIPALSMAVSVQAARGGVPTMCDP